jgi:hypothetical protein
LPSWSRLPDRAAALALDARTATLGRWDGALLLAVLAIAISLRVQLLVGADFPINDGALFLVFVESVARTFPHLPQSVHYNGLTIPFAYPPLAFWVSGAAVRLGAEPLAVVQNLPTLMNIGWVLLFAALLLRCGHSRLFTAIALLVFATTFRSYEWLVMGGGLSRGFGSLFLLLALHALLPPGLWRDGPGWNWKRLVLGGLCVGATVLSHLEWGILCTFSALACVALAKPKVLPFVVAAVVLGAVSSLLVLPWIASVVHVHGLAPFRAASQTSAWNIHAIPESERMLTRNAMVLLPFVLFGTVLVLRTRGVFWVLFMAAAALLIPRSGETPLVLGIGVLAATGLIAVVLAVARWPTPLARPAAAAVALVALALTGLRAFDAQRRDAHFTSLPHDVRAAMAWVAATHPGERFAVVREAPWFYNASAEWFPVLAHATSATTVQGREWLPDQDFDRVYQAVEQLNESTTCEDLLRSLQVLPRVDYVWAEGVDLRARSDLQDFMHRRKTLGERFTSLKHRLRGQPLLEQRDPAGALHGQDTAAGCFETAGWHEVHANALVRIFRVPAQGAAVEPRLLQQGPGSPAAQLRP